MEYSANGTMTCYPSIRSHQFPRCQYIFADFSGTPLLKYEQIVFDSGRTGMALRWEIADFVHPHILQHGSAQNQQTTVYSTTTRPLCQDTSSRCLVPKSGHAWYAGIGGFRRDDLLREKRESVAHSQASWNVALLFFELHKLRVWRIFIPWSILLLLGWPKFLFKCPQVSKLWWWISHTIREVSNVCQRLGLYIVPIMSVAFPT